MEELQSTYVSCCYFIFHASQMSSRHSISFVLAGGETKVVGDGGQTMLSEFENKNFLFVTLHFHLYSLSQRIHRIHHLLGEWRDDEWVYLTDVSAWVCMTMDMGFLHIKISHFPQHILINDHHLWKIYIKFVKHLILVDVAKWCWCWLLMNEKGRCRDDGGWKQQTATSPGMINRKECNEMKWHNINCAVFSPATPMP